MDRQFKDPHQRSRALDKLRHLSQGRRLVRDYISEFNQLLQESEQTFEEETLKSMLAEGLQAEIRKHLIMVPAATGFDEFCNEAIRISDQLYRITMVRKPASTRSPAQHQALRNRSASPERMNWQLTISNQGSS